MVCIYCSGETRVINSRHQKRENHIWRRRQCLDCNTVFTTEEAADLTGAIRVAHPIGTQKRQKIEHFQRDTLFLSVYRTLGHRDDAVEAAGALCSTIIGKLSRQHPGALLEATVISDVTHTTLAHFDTAAAVSYAAYHRMPQR